MLNKRHQQRDDCGLDAKEVIESELCAFAPLRETLFQSRQRMNGPRGSDPAASFLIGPICIAMKAINGCPTHFQNAKTGHARRKYLSGGPSDVTDYYSLAKMDASALA